MGNVVIDNRFVLSYPDGNWVALDAASGGYPYPVNDIIRAEWWNDEERVRRYMRVCHKENFKLYEITGVTLEEI